MLRAGVIGKELGRRAHLLLHVREHREEIGQGVRIVSGVVRDLRAQDVRLALVRARVLEQQGVHGEGAHGGDQFSQRVVAQHASQHGHAHRGRQGLRHLAGAVPQRHVRNLVADHARQLRLIVGGLDQAAVHVHVSARKGKRVDVRHVHAFELVGILLAGSKLRQTLPELVQVTVHLLVFQHGKLLFGLLRKLCAELDVVLRRKQVPAGFQLRAIIRARGQRHEPRDAQAGYGAAQRGEERASIRSVHEKRV